MIELRGVSKTVAERRTIRSPFCIRSTTRSRQASSSPWWARRAAASPRCSGCSPASTRRPPGRSSIDGVDITSLSEDGLAKLRGEKIGFVFQFFHLVPSLTAFENISVPMEIVGRRDAMARARQLIDEVGLADRAHHYPSQLSGGEQQRIAIARALANDPPIVLADEPTGNLDSGTGRIIMDLLLNVRRTRQATLVLVTHDQRARRAGRYAARRCATAGRWTCRWGRRDDLHPGDGAARDSRVVAAAAVLLRLHRHRRRVDRRAPLGDPERARRAGARDADAASPRTSCSPATAAGAGRCASWSRASSGRAACRRRPRRWRSPRWSGRPTAGQTARMVELRAVQAGFPALRHADAARRRLFARRC